MKRCTCSVLHTCRVTGLHVAKVKEEVQMRVHRVGNIAAACVPPRRHGMNVTVGDYTRRDCCCI